MSAAKELLLGMLQGMSLYGAFPVQGVKLPPAPDFTREAWLDVGESLSSSMALFQIENSKGAGDEN